MKIELKKVKTFIGNEGHGLNAEVYVEGVLTCFVMDSANGGCFDYDIHDKIMFQRLNDYAASLPAEPMILNDKPYIRDGKPVTHQPDIDTLIDRAYNEFEKAKLIKKLEKKMVNTIMWGNKERTGSYTQVEFKVPLSQIPIVQLQGFVDKYKASFKEGQEFWNTNLVALGVKL